MYTLYMGDAHQEIKKKIALVDAFIIFGIKWVATQR